jgi:hypothetical protein
VPNERDNERRKVAEEAVKSLPSEEAKSLSEEAREEVAARMLPPQPLQTTTDRTARIMTYLGALLIVAGVAASGAMVWSFLALVPAVNEYAQPGGNISEVLSNSVPLLLVPAGLLFAATLLFVIGYLLLRTSYSASRELIPAGDREMVNQAMEKAKTTREALTEYIRLRSLSGIAGFFTKMSLSGLPLATIALTLIYYLPSDMGGAIFRFS